MISVKEGIPWIVYDSAVRATATSYRLTRPCGPVTRAGGTHGSGGRGLPRLQLVLLLLGWTFATGAHWDLIQLAAWGTMLARNAQVQPLGAAFATTFSPDGMCSACHAVQAAKLRSDDNSVPDVRTPEKPPLVLPAPRQLVVEAPAAIAAVVTADAPLPEWSRPAPPVPPPRLG